MEGPKTKLEYIYYSIFFIPVFLILFCIGIAKGFIVTPVVFVIIGLGDVLIMAALFPVHLFWSMYCILRTKKFGPFMKCLLLLIFPIPVELWHVVGLGVSVTMGVVVGLGWPFMETFKAISKEGVPFNMRIKNCFTAGMKSSIKGALTIVEDFKDFSLHSYFSVVDELLKYKGDETIELKVVQLPGCLLAACIGILVDVPMIIIITIYKAPVLLLKGWYRLVQDLIGREGPFLETVCVPFAAVYILLWPFAVVLAVVAGIFASFGFGCYAAAVAYQESSTKRGLLYVIAAISIFDEYTNDLLYLREGSCYPRPKYSQRGSSASLLPVVSFREQLRIFETGEPFTRVPSMRSRPLQVVVVRASYLGCAFIFFSLYSFMYIQIWDSFMRACEDVGKELLSSGAIGIADLDAWKASKNKIVNIGIPAYVFLECFLSSIKNGSPGFLLRENIAITSVNRPEGRVFDWLYEPMTVMKEQIRSLNLEEGEELYLYKYCLYSGDMKRINAWQNGGLAPQDEIRRAQLEGIGRRLQGFCLTLSRLPTWRRLFLEITKAIEKEAIRGPIGGRNNVEAGYGVHH